MPKLESSSRFELDHSGDVVKGTAALCSNQEAFLKDLFSQFGWSCQLVEKSGSRRHFLLSHSGVGSRDIIVYSGTIRDESRDPYEKKVQLGVGVDPRKDNLNNTIILGIYIFENSDSYKDALLVGFPISSAVNYPSNPSLRGGVKVNDILQKAKVKGLYIDGVSKNVGFRSEFIYYYLDNYEDMHYGENVESQTSSATSTSAKSLLLQQIFFGSPGTGKSFEIKNETAGEKVFRTTFHPDSDYATFVGAYKPIMKPVERMALVGKVLEMADVSKVAEEHKKENIIAYEFVEQVFTKAYIQAWANQKKAAPGEEPKKVYLVIEEINRGNCAQVFGDLFQLLDRNESGFSDYPISPDEDFGKFIGNKISATEGAFDAARKESIKSLYPEVEVGVDIVDEVMAGRLLLLPDNLFIRATMNTSDQSLFPIDSAFKRRWEWTYVPISDAGKEWQIEFETTDADGGTTVKYPWWDFLEKVNEIIYQTTKSEDKQLGYFFCKADGDGKISADKFVNKVLFYLYNDVFKDWALRDAFKDFAFKDFFLASGKTNKENVKKLLDELLKEEPSGSADNK